MVALRVVRVLWRPELPVRYSSGWTGDLATMRRRDFRRRERTRYGGDSNIWQASREHCPAVRAGPDRRVCVHADGSDPVRGPLPGALAAVHGPWLSRGCDRRCDDRGAVRQQCVMALLPDLRRAVPALADAGVPGLHGDLRAARLLHAAGTRPSVAIHPLWPRVAAGDGDMPVRRDPGSRQARPRAQGARGPWPMVDLARGLRRDRRGGGGAGDVADRRRTGG